MRAYPCLLLNVYTRNASIQFFSIQLFQDLLLKDYRKPCIAREATMAGMEQLEIHSKVRNWGRGPWSLLMISSLVIPCPLGQCQSRAYNLLEYTARQEINQLWHFQAPWLWPGSYPKPPIIYLRATAYPKRSPRRCAPGISFVKERVIHRNREAEEYRPQASVLVWNVRSE